MFTTGEKNSVFSQYNISIILVFILIVFSALSVVTFRYFSDLAEHKKNEIQALTQQVKHINSALTVNVDALLSIQKTADYFLTYPENLHANTPSFTQNGELYHLQHRNYDVVSHEGNVRNNITGVGNIDSFNDEHQIELTMSNMLTSAFITTKKINKETVWFYYVSKKRFVSIYPSVNHNSWQYNDALLASEHAQKILLSPENNNAAIWSLPYVSSVGEGLNISLGIGVFNHSEIAGILSIDISLAKIKKRLEKVTAINTGILVLDDRNNVLIHHTVNTASTNKLDVWKSVVPADLATLTHNEIKQLGVYQELGDWLVQKQTLPINGWKVIKYQDYKNFRKPLLTHYIIISSILFLCLFIFLVFVYWVTHRTFVQPTKRFISHIEYCAQGDPGKIKPTSDWLRWFQVVENIFGQNRSLLQRLTDQNLLLDSRVNDKTKELQEKFIQHKRDYALLKSVMNAIPEYIIFNDTDGNIIGFNNAFGRFVGKKKEEEVLGYKANEIIFNDLGAELTKLSVSKKVNNGLQRVIQTNNNTYDIYCTNIHSDAGLEVGTIHIIRDVTTPYAIQAALEKTKDQAEFANKAKSQFLANMSHEIRTPINAIQGMITLLGRSVLSNNQRQHIDNAYGASKSLLYLVDQLLDLAKIESGEMTLVKERTSLDSIINKALLLNIGIINKKGLKIFIDIAPSVPLFIETDEMRLIQVITNLLQNSVKFTEKGEISIIIDVLSRCDKNAAISFKIKDTGIGIALDKQSHLFEAFKQADESMTRQYGGSGLGLSICKQIVQLLGGHISLESELYQGCEFTVELPFIISDEDSKYADSNNLIIGNYGVKLSQTMIKSIEFFGWQYHHISMLEEITQLPQNRNLVLISSEDNLKSIQTSQLQSHIQLLCICQNKYQNINAQEPILEQLTVPYILQEQPIYRHMLHSINKAIYRKNKTEASNIHTEKESLEGIIVLLVEDNLVNQLVAKELLLSMKAEVVIAENGEVALNLLEKHAIDLVLMDIQMPVMDGLTATRQIRKQEKYSRLPIIAMTAHARHEDRDNSLAAGMNLHMAKPVKYETLLHKILLLTKNSALN